MKRKTITKQRMRAAPIFNDSPWTEPPKVLAEGRRSNWAFMERFEVPDFDEPDINYLTRLRVIQTPWFGIYVHRFDRPDSRATLHDHPWSFLSIILRGGYVERRPDRFRQIRFVNRMRLGDAHYIESLTRTPTWSLMVVGRRVRKWGYVEPTDGGFVWTPFDKHAHAYEFDEAMAHRNETVS